MKINGRWICLSDEFVKLHPGGPVIEQYRGADATHIFHAFHEGSKKAYKQLEIQKEVNQPSTTLISTKTNSSKDKEIIDDDDFVVINYDIPPEKEMKIVLEFEELRQKVHSEGLLLPKPLFYVRKIFEVFTLLFFAFWLQYKTFYIFSALILALTWQQMGWLCHECCHHQPTKNRRINDFLSLFLGNFSQGFSRDWWKDKHNLHHATTNIISRDGDIDLAPLLALVPDDLFKQKTLISNLILRLIIPYQYFYFTLMYPLLRISWVTQSILHLFTSSKSKYKNIEMLLYLNNLLYLDIGFGYFCSFGYYLLFILELFILLYLIAGTLIALVVSYNHNSVPKFPENSGLLNNFAALHILTTRNMKSSPFVDWFWGGLNFQIEHHLFPTMPRPNLGRCSQLVRQFCKNNQLPYMEDDFFTGYFASLKLLHKVSKQAIEINKSSK
uniref:Uncharacterized protein n=1 Tax=Meloidogyne enterolobii TaxID=390850 RepID=A0A6V7VN18_MELEN|nr:unnamed protein product [Meloidogyne enterolobii]